VRTYKEYQKLLNESYGSLKKSNYWVKIYCSTPEIASAVMDYIQDDLDLDGDDDLDSDGISGSGGSKTKWTKGDIVIGSENAFKYGKELVKHFRNKIKVTGEDE
jgi:hypothetical protein